MSDTYEFKFLVELDGGVVCCEDVKIDGVD